MPPPMGHGSRAETFPLSDFWVFGVPLSKKSRFRERIFKRNTAHRRGLGNGFPEGTGQLTMKPLSLKGKTGIFYSGSYCFQKISACGGRDFIVSQKISPPAGSYFSPKSIKKIASRDFLIFQYSGNVRSGFSRRGGVVVNCLVGRSVLTVPPATL